MEAINKQDSASREDTGREQVAATSTIVPSEVTQEEEPSEQSPSSATSQTISHSTSPNQNTYDEDADTDAEDEGAATPENSEAADRTLTTVSTNSPPYTVFTKGERWFIIMMSSLAGFFSPLSANIYYPALTTLSEDLHVSISLINLTITSYMIFQGLSPMFIGNFADAAGRRPAYIIGFTIYILANIGIALQDNYAALFILRCLQSTGSSPTIALSFGVVADVTTSADRGVAMGFASAGSLLGPSLGPIIGGLLSQFLSWRAIFWFLAIFSGAYIVVFVIAVPETGRKIVGNGSIKPVGWNKSVLDILTARKAAKAHPDSDEASAIIAQRPKLRFPNPWRTIKICTEKEAGLLLLFNGLVFSAFYQVLTAMSSQFKVIYGYDDLHIGLCYIPFGIGSSLTALVTGKFLDMNYRRHAKKHNLPISKNKQQDLRNFPIERARIEILLPLLYVNCGLLVAFGWILQYKLHVYAPLIVLFFLGYCSSGAAAVCNNLIVDLYPSAPSTATAANNLFRCLLGAGATALVIPMIDAMGLGWTFTFDALVLAVISPVLFALIKFGPKWREEIRVKEEKQALEKERAKAAVEEEGMVKS